MSDYYHVVMLKLAAGADDAFHRKVEEFCRAIRAQVDGVVSYDYEANEASRAKGFGHAVISRFVSEEAHEAYQVCPLHVEMKTFMAPMIEDLIVLDCTTGGRG
jgi:hypothetical protein